MANIPKLTPDGWRWYQLIVAGVLLAFGASLMQPVVGFASGMVRQGASIAASASQE